MKRSPVVLKWERHQEAELFRKRMVLIALLFLGLTIFVVGVQVGLHVKAEQIQSSQDLSLPHGQ